MVRAEIQVSDTARYSIAETCGILGVHRNTLRRYTDGGLIRCGHRRGTGQKFYLGSEIRRFWKAVM